MANWNAPRNGRDISSPNKLKGENVMGPGHLGVAFVTKTFAPKAPLWTLLVASETLDLLCFGFFAIGIEHAGVTQTDLTHGVRIITDGLIPWSHGLFMSIVWSALAAGIAYWVWRARWASAAIGLVVFSHWALDFIVHLPDLPLFLDGSPKVGLGIWGSGPGLIISGILEISLFIAGIMVYYTWRKKKGSTGRWNEKW
jgi:hypothetical protein